MRVLLIGLLLTFGSASVSQAATFTVTNLDDSGAGSLRAAIDRANASAGADTIDFTVSGTIVLESTLPNITDTAGLTIDGAGRSVTISGNHSVQVMVVWVGAVLEVKHLTIANGRASDGGGINNLGTLSVTSSTLSGNSATSGGGGVMNLDARLTITDSTFSGNSANQGGAVFNRGDANINNSTLSGNSAVNGGAISTIRVINLVNSTLTGNLASNAGGGIYGDAEQGVPGGNLRNSTLTGNSAANAGGGIYLTPANPLTIDNSTFSGNTSTAGGGIWGTGWPVAVTNSTFSGSAIYDPFAGDGFALSLSNTIVANSTCSGVADGGYNIERHDSGEAPTCGFSGTSWSTTDPVLDPSGLQNNGGLTQTIALLPGSPAIDVIPTGVNGCGASGQTDQRGVTRPQESGCDIGAFEREAFAFTFTGFFAPVGNLPTINVVKAGSAVPVKFSLGGDHGLDVLAGSPTAPAIACTPGNPTDNVTEVVTAGSSGLQFDPITLTYTFVWKTDKAFANTCRELQITLTDGSVHKARFQFSR